MQQLPPGFVLDGADNGPIMGPPPKPPAPQGPPQGYRPNGNGLEIIPGGPADPRRPGGEYDPNKPAGAGDKLTVDQRSNQAYADRGFRALQVYGKAGLGPRSVAGESIASLPGGTWALGALPDAVGDSPERQISEQAKRDFATIILRSDSGANAPEPEVVRLVGTYFPGPNETDPTVIENYQQARISALNGVRSKAGLPPMSEDEIKQLAFGGGQAPAEPSGPLTDEQVVAEMNVRIARGDPPSATLKWLFDMGRVPNKAEIDAIVANDGNKNPNSQMPNREWTPLERTILGLPPETGNGRALGLGVGDIAEGAGDILGIVANPLNAGINWATGSNLGTDLGQSFRNLIGAPSPETDSERLASSINTAATGGFGFAGAARAAAPYAGRVAGEGLARLAAAPLTDAVAGGGGGASGEIARQSGASPGVQLLSSLVGGATSAAGASRVGRIGQSAPPIINPVARAGEAEGVTVNRAMVDPNVQNRVTGVEATMAGGPIVRRGMDNVAGQIEGRVQNLSNGGQPLEQGVAGQTVQSAADRYIKTSGQQFKRRYDTIEQEVGSIKVAPTQSIGVVDGVIAKLSELSGTNKAELAYLADLKSDLSKDLSVGALRSLRTTLRKKISKGELTFGESEADVLSVMDAASQDIAAGLTAQGKAGAAAAFKQVDGDYRDRMEFIQGTVQKLVGKRGANLPPGRVLENLKNMTSPKGDNAGFARMMREMEPDEQADIAATLAEGLGKNGKGEFSTAHLVTQAQKLPRAVRVAAFGEEGAKSLENLITLANSHSRVMGGLNNSRTGVANNYRSWIANVFFGGGAGIATGSGMTGLAVGAAGFGAKAARDVINARMVMSPKISKWLASAPNTTSAKAINAHHDRLKALAVREPALAPEVDQISQMLSRAANENVTPGLAAQEGDPNNE